jgi:hypothetical protein
VQAQSYITQVTNQNVLCKGGAVMGICSSLAQNFFVCCHQLGLNPEPVESTEEITLLSAIKTLMFSTDRTPLIMSRNTKLFAHIISTFCHHYPVSVRSGPGLIYDFRFLGGIGPVFLSLGANMIIDLIGGMKFW